MAMSRLRLLTASPISSNPDSPITTLRHRISSPGNRHLTNNLLSRHLINSLMDHSRNNPTGNPHSNLTDRRRSNSRHNSVRRNPHSRRIHHGRIRLVPRRRHLLLLETRESNSGNDALSYLIYLRGGQGTPS